MRLLVLYRPDSEFSRLVEEFIDSYKRRNQVGRLEIMNYDSRDGSATASLYDIMQQPAVLALREDGSVLKTWQGSTMPLMDEVASYTYS